MLISQQLSKKLLPALFELKCDLQHKSEESSISCNEHSVSVDIPRMFSGHTKSIDACIVRINKKLPQVHKLPAGKFYSVYHYAL